jgi:hypothetical protein
MWLAAVHHVRSVFCQSCQTSHHSEACSLMQAAWPQQFTYKCCNAAMALCSQHATAAQNNGKSDKYRNALCICHGRAGRRMPG